MHLVCNIINLLRDRAQVICTQAAINARGNNPSSLNTALDYALDKNVIDGQFFLFGAGADRFDTRELIIFSNCRADDQDDICTNYEDLIRNPSNSPQGTDSGINVNMVNTIPSNDNGYNIVNPNTYLSCLTEYDPNGRIFNPPNPSNDNDIKNIIDNVQNSICTQPTPTPTTDPTIDPTSDPTRDPTADPTTDPTRDPTTDPTVHPTKSPTLDECVSEDTDIIILVDSGCGDIGDSDGS